MSPRARADRVMDAFIVVAVAYTAGGLVAVWSADHGRPWACLLVIVSFASCAGLRYTEIRSRQLGAPVTSYDPGDPAPRPAASAQK